MFESAARYPHAFRPIALGPALVRNRIFVPAHTTNYGEDNLPSRRHLDYHRARAAGGVGLIIFEAIRVHRSSLGRSFHSGIHEQHRGITAAIAGGRPDEAEGEMRAHLDFLRPYYDRAWKQASKARDQQGGLAK